MAVAVDDGGAAPARAIRHPLRHPSERALQVWRPWHHRGYVRGPCAILWQAESPVVVPRSRPVFSPAYGRFGCRRVAGGRGLRHDPATRLRVPQRGGCSMFGFLLRRPEHPRMAQIRQIGLFATLRPKELRVIDGLLYERRYLEGEIVFDEGEEGQALYVVLSGRALICKRGDAGLAADRGNTHRFAVRRACVAVGIAALGAGAGGRGLRAGRIVPRRLRNADRDACGDRHEDRAAARPRPRAEAHRALPGAANREPL